MLHNHQPSRLVATAALTILLAGCGGNNYLRATGPPGFATAVTKMSRALYKEGSCPPDTKEVRVNPSSFEKKNRSGHIEEISYFVVECIQGAK